MALKAGSLMATDKKYKIAYLSTFSPIKGSKHELESPKSGEEITEHLIFRGRLTRCFQPLTQLTLSFQPKGQNPPQANGQLSTNRQAEYVYHLTLDLTTVDTLQPVSLQARLANGEQSRLAEIFVGPLATMRELLVLAERMWQANDWASIRAIGEKILTTQPKHRGALTLLYLLQQILVKNDQLAATMTNGQSLLAWNLGQPAIDTEELAKLAEKYQCWELALRALNQCLAKPSTAIKVEWLASKGGALLALNRLTEAEAFFQQAINYVPHLPFAYAALGHVAQLQEKWAVALEHWEICLQRFPQETALVAKWLERKAQAHLALKQVELAEAVLQQLLHHYPPSATTYTRLITLATKRHQWQQAITYCNNRIAAFPANEGFYHELWNLLQEQRQLELAAQQYQTELTQQPLELSLLIRLAGVLELQGELQAAVEVYHQARTLGTLPDWLHLRLVDTLIDLNRLSEAETELRQRYTQPQQQAQLLGELANLAMRSQQWHLALERWQHLHTRQPQDLGVGINEAITLVELNRPEDAKKQLEQLAENFPHSRLPWENLARLAKRQKDFATALKYYEATLAIEPKNFLLKLAYADTLLSLMRLDEAKLIYEWFATQFSEKPQGLRGLAQVARLIGDFELCLTYCQQLQQQFPGIPDSYHEAEQAYIELGQFEQANQMFLANPTNHAQQSVKKPVATVTLPNGLILPKIVGKNNDYTFIEEKVEQFLTSGQPYTLPVSIIIPVYNRKNLLAKTLAALTHQTYPRKLIEVVVADDGSSDGVEDVIRKYQKLLDLKYVYQPDEGFRLSAVRNLGMRTARHDYFIILDCDVIPVPQLVECYMRVFHVSDRVAMMGLRRFVCTDAVSDDDILKDINVVLKLPDIKSSSEFSDIRSASGTTFDWSLPTLVKTNNLKNHRWPFTGFVGANMVHSRAAVSQVGGYDESFQAWGCEDTEMGYRLYNAGYYFIPVMDAVGLHQEPPGGKNETDRQTGKSMTWQLFEEKCPVPLISRNYQKGKIYEVPKVSIYIPAYNAAKYIKAAVDSALNQTYTDLEVCICNDGSTDNTLQILEENYANNPRVRWVSQPNGGTAKASNTAVRLCRGMYIGQLDADDLLKPHAVELAVNYLDNHDVGFVYTECEIIDSEGKFVKPFQHSDTFSHEGLLYGNIVGPFRFYRKRDWIRAGGFSEDLATAVDYDLVLKMAEVCDLHHIDDANYSYRWHGENTSVVKRQQQISDHFLIINRALQRMGLHEWEAVQADATQPRSVKLQRKLYSKLSTYESSLENKPKLPIIQSLWIGNRLSTLEQLSITSFLKNGHEFHLYIYDEVLNIPAGTILKDANEIIPKSKIIVHKETGSYALFSNIFRYKLLLMKGNYWVDADVICLRPFDVNRDYVFAVEKLANYQGQKVASCVIKVPVNSAIMNYCYEQAISTANVENLAWGTIGPELIHRAVIKHNLQEYMASYQDFCPIHWWECFKLVDGKTPIPANSYAIHFWNEMWRRKGLDKDATYNSSSIYFLLKAKYLPENLIDSALSESRWQEVIDLSQDEPLRKPKLKLAIADYWPGAIPGELLKYSLLFQLLDRHYTLELSDDPDVLFFSVFGNEHKKYHCLKVLYTGENRKPPAEEYDFSFSFAATNAVNFYFPLFVGYPYFWEFKKQQYSLEIQLLRHYTKLNFCNFIYSNANAHQRIEFCKKLMEYKKVDCPGSVLNNMPRISMDGMDKLNFMKKYKFSIAFENESSLDYTTEKIYHSFLVGSIPIYWGNPEISQWFNPASFINCHDYSNFDQVIERIIEIDNDEALYQSYRNAPPLLTDSKVDLINADEILERLDFIAKTALSSRIKSS
jgi:glycosyltransferase involved in cell wall biosynthesis/Tfp pilus assembly protein PilF